MTISSTKRNNVYGSIKSLKLDRFAEQECIDAFEAAVLADDANKINVADTICGLLREKYRGDSVMAAGSNLMVTDAEIDTLRIKIIEDLE